VPELPEGFEMLFIGGADALLELPALPTTLNELSLSGNGIVQLPSLPAGLQRLQLSNMSMPMLPAIPAGLEALALTSMSGLSVVPPLPATMPSLRLEGLSALTALELPVQRVNMLELRDLPLIGAEVIWPDSIHQLDLTMAHWDTLHQWPFWADHIRFLSMPLIDDLPPILQSGLWLDFYNMTGITDIPDPIGHLRALSLETVPYLTCLPLLPDTMFLWTSATGLTCVPNLFWTYDELQGGYVQYQDVIEGSVLPLCTSYNTACPLVNPVISGSVYHDQNENGARDPGEPTVPNATITVEPVGITSGLDTAGAYHIGVPPGTWTITASYTNAYLEGIVPAFHSATVVNVTDEDGFNDFGVIMPTGIEDLAVSGLWNSPARPGFNNELYLTYGNNGTIGTAGTVSFIVDGSQTFVSAYPSPASVVGQVVTWEIADIPIGASANIHVTLMTDVSIPLGTPLVHILSAQPSGVEETPADNTVLVPDTVVGSYDPNDKQVVPASMSPEQVQQGDRLIYTVRFQNTGTYAAERVIVTDPLSADLQWNTFEMISASDVNSWTLHNGLLEVVFNNINLPDSASDEGNSHGYFQFSIEPESSLLDGQSVSNIANIYFDYNAPVITNEAMFTVDVFTAVNEEKDAGFNVWPNPAGDVLMITTAEPMSGSLEVLDLTGRILMRENVKGRGVAMDVRSLAEGSYVVRVNVAGRVRSLAFKKG
jgi:uncharacterized repeat protein (TIGR01451 family)